jgi:hypothetical protein
MFTAYRCISIAILFIATCMPLPAVAGIVTTTEIVNARQVEHARAHLNSLLAREDVRKALAARGVDVAAAQRRVASMTDSEVQKLAANIDQLPAGGRLNNLETILLVIIIILLI